MNEELIRQCAREVAEKHPNKARKWDANADCIEAIRLYHARHVAPLVEAVEAHRKAVWACTMPLAGQASQIDEVGARLTQALAAFGKGEE